MNIAQADFDFVCELVRTQSGIELERGKEYLVEARLSTLINREKIDSISALVLRLKTDPTGLLRRHVVEAMTTNETSFFRDLYPFEALKKQVLPNLIARRCGSKALSIWCGASSTGQEPYSIAMTLCESFPELANWRVTLIATDISTEMIERSRQGKYNQIEINRGLPARLQVKYFDKVGVEWQIKPRLRQMIDFREMNLAQKWPLMLPVDVIFLRNVLIYFNDAAKRQILSNIRQVLAPDGYLFLGCAETTLCLDDSYERIEMEKTSCYRVKRAAAVAA